MILVSFFLEEDIFIRLNQNIAYFAIEKYRKSTVPLFLGYAVYKKSHKPFLNFLHKHVKIHRSAFSQTPVYRKSHKPF